MKRNKVTALCMALGLIVALTLGGCGGTEGNKTDSTVKSTITQAKDDAADKTDKDKDKAEGKTKDTDKDAKSDKNDKSDKDSKSDKSDKTKDKASDTKTTSAKTSSTKSSSNKSNGSKPSSGNSNKPSSGNSNKPSSGNSNKPSSGNSNKPSSGNSSKPSSGNNSGNNSKPAHTHSYSSSVTKQPTCSSAGVRTYTCSCGKSYTESIPATGAHKWKDQYELQKIPAQTHEEPYTVWICNGCNTEFTNSKDISRHIMAVFGDACSSYTSTVRYETVIDAPAREENVYVGAKCETCGAWK